MDVAVPFQIIPVISSARRLQLLLHESDRDVEENVQVRFRETELVILRIENPLAKLLTLSRIRHLRALVRDVRIHISVQQHGTAFIQSFPHLGSSPVPVLGIKKGHKLRMHSIDGTESATQELAYEFPVDRGVIPRKMNIFQILKSGLKICAESFYLCGFS